MIRRKFFSVSNNAPATQRSTIAASRQRLTFAVFLRTILKRDDHAHPRHGRQRVEGFRPGPDHVRAADDMGDVVSPFLEGKDPSKWRELQFDAPLETRKTYRAVEVALIDLAAKYEGAPMSELIGGRRRDRIKCYGSAGMYMPPEGYAEEATGIQAMGFAAYKMRPAAGPDADLETVRAVRAATGPEFGLMIDAHARWRMGDRSYTQEPIEQLCRDLRPYNPT